MDAFGKRKWRICMDFRRLNNITVGDSFPLTKHSGYMGIN